MQQLRKAAWNGVQALRPPMGLFVLTIDRDVKVVTCLKGKSIYNDARYHLLYVGGSC